MPPSPHAVPMHPVFLTFADVDQERDYRAAADRRLRYFYLAANVLTIFSWLSLIWGTGHRDPAQQSTVNLVAGIGVLLPCTFIVALVLLRRGVSWWVPLCALENLVEGFLTLYLTLAVLRDTLLFAVVLPSVAYFAFLVLRLPFRLALGVTTSYMVAGVVSLRTIDWAPASDLALLTTTLPLILGVAVFVGYVLERTARRSYLQQLTIAAQREEIAAEHERSETLLRNILPAEIAERLKAGAGTIAESHGEVSVLFSDIVGFTSLSDRLPPEEVVTHLNAVFSRFDALAERHGVAKIKTIGDAFMAIAGAPHPAEDHALRCARMSLDMIAAVSEYNRGAGTTLQIRVGIHSGPVVAGVIGSKTLHYDLWGDTVNIASRMESSGVPGLVQVSEQTHALIHGAFPCEPRGELEIKGKGAMRTWLLGPAAPPPP